MEMRSAQTGRGRPADWVTALDCGVPLVRLHFLPCDMQWAGGVADLVRDRQALPQTDAMRLAIALWICHWQSLPGLPIVKFRNPVAIGISCHIPEMSDLPLAVPYVILFGRIGLIAPIHDEL